MQESQMETGFCDVDEVVIRQRTKSKTDNSNYGTSKAKGASPEAEPERSEYTPRSITAVIILNFVNLLNYADRGTVPGILDTLQEFFEVDFFYASFFQFVFIISYTLLAPLFGYLGDRYNRKLLMIVGIAIWSGATVGGSFANTLPVFLFWRGAVGIGEASYSTIAPTIISDLFSGKRRSLMLTAFYVAIPIGSGIGYGLASLALNISHHDWRWSFRITPIGGVVCCFLLFFFLKEPKRGEVEGPAQEERLTSYGEELLELIRNKTYVYVTFGFTTIAFSVGALQYWTPSAIIYATWTSNVVPTQETWYFSICVIVGGLGGTSIGTVWATHWKKTNPGADALVCAVGGLVAGPLIFFAMLSLDGYFPIFWTLLPLIMIALCFNWALVVDITTYVVPVQYRATAIAFQTLMSHILGDAFSPMMVGALATALSPDDMTYKGLYEGLRFALYITCFIAVLGGLFFLLASIYLPEDKQNVQKRSKLDQARQDVIDEHLQQQRLEEEQREEQLQRELYRQKTEAAAGKRQNRFDEAVLMHYVKRTSVDGKVNLGFYPDQAEELENGGAGRAKHAMRVRPNAF